MPATPDEARDDEATLHLIRERLRAIAESAREQRAQAQYELPDMAEHRAEALLVALDGIAVSLEELYE